MACAQLVTGVPDESNQAIACSRVLGKGVVAGSEEVAGIAGGELRSQPLDGLALAYYYLMIGISMSVKLYEKEALLRDTRAAWASFAGGLASPHGADTATHTEKS